MHATTELKSAVVLAFIFSFVLKTTSALAGPVENELFEAARAGSTDRVTALIIQGANINAKAERGFTALTFPPQIGPRCINAWRWGGVQRHQQRDTTIPSLRRDVDS